MPFDELLHVFDEKKYIADLDRGIILNARSKPLFAELNHQGYSQVRVYSKPFCLFTQVHRIIWQIGHRHPIPDRWEIHHIDTDITHNSLSNLICLHPDDHLKVHKGFIVTGDTPF